MNIKNRIEKLEAASRDAGFCKCQGLNAVCLNIDSDHFTKAEAEQLIAEAGKPEYCGQCRMQIEKLLTVIMAGKEIGQWNLMPGAIHATFNIGTRPQFE